MMTSSGVTKLPADHVLTALTRSGASWDVLAFIGSLNVGGCERHLATVYPRLAAAGLKVGIVTFKRGGPLEEQVRSGGVDVMCLDRMSTGRIFGRDLSRITLRFTSATMIVDIARLLRSRRVGIAHFFLPGAYIFGGLGAVLARHSNSIMSRRSLNDYQASHPIATWLERFLHPKMRLLTANARLSVRQLLDEGAPPDRTLLLHNGVDLAKLTSALDRDAARRRFEIEPDTVAIAIVANLIPYKGHADLIEAIGKLSSQIEQKWVLFVAGRDDGPARALKERADSLGIASNIRWLGLISDVQALWRAVDIGVLASHEEGLPNSLLEGMAMGVPMVTTRVGGVSDIATDNLDALLVPARDPDAMAAALAKLVTDPQLRSRLGQNAALRIRQSFSLDACVNAYLRLYELMLCRPQLPSTDIVRQFPLGSNSVAEGTLA